MASNNNGFDPKDRSNNDNNKNQEVKNAANNSANEQEVAVAELEEVDPIEYYGL